MYVYMYIMSLPVNDIILKYNIIEVQQWEIHENFILSDVIMSVMEIISRSEILI